MIKRVKLVQIMMFKICLSVKTFKLMNRDQILSGICNAMSFNIAELFCCRFDSIIIVTIVNSHYGNSCFCAVISNYLMDR